MARPNSQAIGEEFEPAKSISLQGHQMTTSIRTAISQAINNARPAICEDVAQWARERGFPVTTLHDAIFGEISGLGAGDFGVRSKTVKTIFDGHRRSLSLRERWCVRRTAW